MKGRFKSHDRSKGGSSPDSNFQKAKGPTGLLPRKLQKLTTRRNLIKAARRLFIQHGFDNVRPIDITRAANVGYGSFYNSFKSKTDCYLAFIYDILDENIQIVQWYVAEAKAKTPSQVLPIVLRKSFEYSLLQPGAMQEMMSNYDKVFENTKFFMLSYIEQWKKGGLISADIDSDLLNYMISGAFYRAHMVVIKHPEKLEEIVQDLTKFTLYGMGSPKRLSARGQKIKP